MIGFVARAVASIGSRLRRLFYREGSKGSSEAVESAESSNSRAVTASGFAGTTNIVLWIRAKDPVTVGMLKEPILAQCEQQRFVLKSIVVCLDGDNEKETYASAASLAEEHSAYVIPCVPNGNTPTFLLDPERN